jgi:hypothetical protein
MRSALAVAAFFFVTTVHAAPFAVQLGDTRIGLDAPPGFSDTTFTGSPRLQDLAETLTSASNRILLFAISDADMRRFTVGDTPEFRRYLIAVTPKGLERERVNPAAFGAFVSDALRELGAPPADPDYLKYLDAQPVGKVSLLSELRRDPEVVSVLQGTRLPDQNRIGEPSRYLLSTTTLLLVRGKALNVAVYSLYENAADVDWIRATTTRWIDELQRLNNRNR